ncbi:hypothetical protein TgHK011_001499 [Trichoderma gracile]|nr:hypothetical protein TgHK011_001499 [Trichoderma gracile]
MCFYSTPTREGAGEDPARAPVLVPAQQESDAASAPGAHAAALLFAIIVLVAGGSRVSLRARVHGPPFRVASRSSFRPGPDCLFEEKAPLYVNKHPPRHGKFVTRRKYIQSKMNGHERGSVREGDPGKRAARMSELHVIGLAVGGKSIQNMTIDNDSPSL